MYPFWSKPCSTSYALLDVLDVGRSRDRERGAPTGEVEMDDVTSKDRVDP